MARTTNQEIQVTVESSPAVTSRSSADLEDEMWQERQKKVGKAMQDDMAQAKLLESVSRRQRTLLEEDIEYYKNHNNVESTKELEKAEKLLDMLNIKKKLLEDCDNENLQGIQEDLNYIEQMGYNVELQTEMMNARRLRDRLIYRQRQSQMRHSVKLTCKVMQEVRSYPQPSLILQKNLQATLLILGENEGTLKCWSDLRKHCITRGQKSISRRMADFDPYTATLKATKKAEATLTTIEDQYGTKLPKVLMGSAAEPFYVWNKTAIQDIKEINGDDYYSTSSNSRSTI